MQKILMFSGSCRKGSYNQSLIDIAASIAKSKGAIVSAIDLGLYPMPIYNADLENDEGQPDTANELFKLIAEHDAMVIASPEYNGLPSPLLKNTIDWVTRIDVGVFSGKKAAIIAASPGGLGGIRGLPHLRTLLTNLNVLVIPQQLTLSNAATAFSEDGLFLKDEAQQSRLEAVINTLLKT